MFLDLSRRETITLVILDTRRIPSIRQMISMASESSMTIKTDGQILSGSLDSLPIEALRSRRRSINSRLPLKTTPPRISRIYVAVLAAALILL